MKLVFAIATLKDIPKIIRLHNEVANTLTEKFGQGHWSSLTTEGGVKVGISNTSHLLLAYYRSKLAGTLRLAQKKPWAIDVQYFRPCKRPLYLTGMVVKPELQFKGIGRKMIEEAIKHSHAWPADAVRLDAYDSTAGAGEFYLKCGFTEIAHVVYKGTPLIYFEMLLEKSSDHA